MWKRGGRKSAAEFGGGGREGGRESEGSGHAEGGERASCNNFFLFLPSFLPRLSVALLASALAAVKKKKKKKKRVGKGGKSKACFFLARARGREGSSLLMPCSAVSQSGSLSLSLFLSLQDFQGSGSPSLPAPLASPRRKERGREKSRFAIAGGRKRRGRTFVSGTRGGGGYSATIVLHNNIPIPAEGRTNGKVTRTY